MSSLFPSSPSTIRPWWLPLRGWPPQRPTAKNQPPPPPPPIPHSHHQGVNTGPPPFATTAPLTSHFIVLVTNASLQAATTAFLVFAMLLEKENVVVAPRCSLLPLLHIVCRRHQNLSRGCARERRKAVMPRRALS